MSQLSLLDAEFVVQHWRLTAHHEEAAKLILDKFHGLQKEAEEMLEEIERLQPPIDSTNIIPVGEYVKMYKEKDAVINNLYQQISDLQRKLAAALCGRKK